MVDVFLPARPSTDTVSHKPTRIKPEREPDNDLKPSVLCTVPAKPWLIRKEIDALVWDALPHECYPVIGLCQ